MLRRRNWPGTKKGVELPNPAAPASRNARDVSRQHSVRCRIYIGTHHARQQREKNSAALCTCMYISAMPPTMTATDPFFSSFLKLCELAGREPMNACGRPGGFKGEKKAHRVGGAILASFTDI